MRAVPTSYIKNDVVLAENIYNKEGAVLIRNGATITPHTISKINAVGIFTIYISDEFSPSMDMDYLVDINVRIRGVNILKGIYEKVRKGQSIDTEFHHLEKLFEDTYSEILDAKSRQVNYIDIKSVDNYIYGHALNVAILSTLVGMDLGLKVGQLKSLFYGAALHDVGMMFLAEEKYAKDGHLIEEELLEVQKHPQLGHDYIKNLISADAYMKNIILTHHERMNGTGYPKGTMGESLHQFAKIVAVCDVYDAMTSDRLHKKAVPPSEAIEFIMGDGGEHFDMAIIESFCRRINPYPEGSLVKLNTGKIALVTKVIRGLPLRPQISIIENVGPKLVFTEVDLYEKRNIVIIGPHY